MRLHLGIMPVMSASHSWTSSQVVNTTQERRDHDDRCGEIWKLVKFKKRSDHQTVLIEDADGTILLLIQESSTPQLLNVIMNIKNIKKLKFFPSDTTTTYILQMLGRYWPQMQSYMWNIKSHVSRTPWQINAFIKDFNSIFANN